MADELKLNLTNNNQMKLALSTLSDAEIRRIVSALVTVLQPQFDSKADQTALDEVIQEVNTNSANNILIDLKCFKPISEDTANKTITLDSVEGLTVGKQLIKAKYNSNGVFEGWQSRQIKEINGTTVMLGGNFSYHPDYSIDYEPTVKNGVVFNECLFDVTTLEAIGTHTLKITDDEEINYFHLEGVNNKGVNNSFVAGTDSIVAAFNGLSLGTENIITGIEGIIIGNGGKVTAKRGVMIGCDGESNGLIAISIGYGCKANGDYSHSQNYFTTANGENSHSQNYKCASNGKNSHSGGCCSDIRAENAFGHGEAIYIHEDNKNKFAVGQYNHKTRQALFAVGNGKSESERSDAFYVTKDGDGVFAGDISFGNIPSLQELLTPQMHSKIFRGKPLGNEVTEEQKEAIRTGEFTDLFIGDYWEINGIKWRIVDIDYWYDIGYIGQWGTHHLVIMPDTCLYNARMNGYIFDTDTKSHIADTTTGYALSEMRTTNLAQATTIIKEAFGDMIFAHSETLSNAVTDGIVTGTINDNYATIELPDEIMMFGRYIKSKSTHETYSRCQLSLFNIAPQFISSQTVYWLRDIASKTDFVRVTDRGMGSSQWASVTNGVRPVFGICVK